jgi:prolyl oligopeptidase
VLPRAKKVAYEPSAKSCEFELGEDSRKGIWNFLDDLTRVFSVGPTRNSPLEINVKFPSLPITRRENIVDIIHGVEVPDPYRWLEDGACAETRAWIAAQQEYATQFLRTPERERIRTRLAELTKIDAVGIPLERGGYYFFARRSADEQRAVICRRRGLDGTDETLIDANAMSTDHMLGAHIVNVSRDGSLMLYGVRRGGEDEYEIRVMEVESRRNLDDVLPRARYYGASWKHDRSGFFYATRVDRTPRIRFHLLGTAPSADREIQGAEFGREWYAAASVTFDGRYLVVAAGRRTARGNCNHVYVRRLDPEGPIVLVTGNVEAEFIPHYAPDALIILTDWNAPNRRVMRVDLANPSLDASREIVPERDARIESASTVGGRIAVNYLENVRSRICIFEADGTPKRELELPGAGTASGLSGRWDRTEAFFTFTAFNHAPAIYRYDVATGNHSVWWQFDAPNAHLDKYETRQVWYASKDGTRIPMYLFHRRGLGLDGSRPVLLTGYGGFGLSLHAAYSPSALMWAESDGVFAQANLRGGGEFGHRWHQAGRRENKQNVFDDFIAAAEWLIANGYTRPSKLAIRGGSNGGLLVGAAMTQRPEIFRVVVCSRPVLDMMRKHLNEVGRINAGEYGSPEDPKQFNYLLAYSPYQNVHDGTRYPSVMFITGDLDSRVDPMQARKMCAALQRASASRENPVVLHYRPEAGHIPGLPLDATIDEGADILTFLAGELGFEIR